MTVLQNYFQIPAGLSEDESQTARLLRVIIGLIFVPSVLIPPVFLLIHRLTQESTISTIAIAGGIVQAIACVYLFHLVKQGRLNLVGVLVSVLLFAVITIKIYFDQGLTDRLLPSYVLVIGIAGLIFGGRAAMMATGATIGALLLIYNAEVSGQIQIDILRSVDLSDLIIYIVIFFLMGLLLRTATNSIAVRNEQIRQANLQLQHLNEDLERRVSERTRALRLTVEVSRQLSTILDPSVLLQEVVELIGETFSYYHVHIYVLNDANGVLKMVGGTGEIGRQLLAQNHQITIDRGLVGQAVRDKGTVLVRDVNLNSAWVANPLLPQTQAELAVPITLGEQILGVLDVQHSVRDSLDEEDAITLRAVANQLAVALRNARAFSLAQEQAQQEAIVNELSAKIQQTRDIQTVLQTAVHSLGRSLYLPHARIRIGTSGQE